MLYYFWKRLTIFKEVVYIIYIDLSSGDQYLRNPSISESLSTYFITDPKFKDTVFHFSHSSRTSVVVGVNQDVYSEVNLDYIQAHQITLSRRAAGGGAVYIDPGNLTYAFVDNDNGTDYLNFKKYATPVIRVLKQLGVDAEMTGRNDLTVNGMKFSGMSSLKIGNRFSCGGTIMLDVNLNAASQSLTPPKTKLASKGIKSVHSRVTNIRQFFKPEFQDISIDQLKGLILKEVFQVKDLSKIPTYKMTEEDWQGVKRIADNSFKTKNWIMGKKMNDDYFHTNHYNGIGTIEMSFSVSGGLINHAKIFGDFNKANGNLSEIETQLTGTPYNPKSLLECFKNSHLNQNIGAVTPEELTDLMINKDYNTKK